MYQTIPFLAKYISPWRFYMQILPLPGGVGFTLWTESGEGPILEMNGSPMKLGACRMPEDEQAQRNQ